MKRIEDLGISPIPWSYDGGVLRDNDYGEIVSGCEDGFGGSCVDVQDTDGRLMAAAPELYEALMNCVDALQKIYNEECTDYETGQVFDDAKKTLAKASGEEVAR